MKVYVVMSHYDLDYSEVDRIQVICLTEEIARQKEVGSLIIQENQNHIIIYTK